MRIHLRVLFSVLLLLGSAAGARSEVLVRWDQNQVPSPQSLGISTLVVPAKNAEAVQAALTQGYRVFLEVESSALAGLPRAEGPSGIVVRGKITPDQLRQVRQRLDKPGFRVISLEERGKWPHIRSNWVTRNKDVLQVTGRSAQPWIENNAALLRIAHAEAPGSTPMLTYAWAPVTLADKDEGPGIENYLVAIAEAGSFGGDLLLPLHERFQKSLLLGQPQARAGWDEIRRYIEFYAWSSPRRYHSIANIGVVTAEPMLSFEVMNLLTRHNLPFELIDPARMPARSLDRFELLIVLDKPDSTLIGTLANFARNGHIVVLTSAQGDFPWRSAAPTVKTEQRVVYPLGEGRVVEVATGIADPDAFALEMRQLLGRGHRVIDIWNGITVMTAPYEYPESNSVLVTVLNYAHQALPVQLRVRGTFSLVQYESPDESPTLLPHQHRDGYTELVLPALRVGGRIFLSRVP